MYKKFNSIKLLRGEKINLKIAYVTDKHCGKNDVNELYMWTYEIGLKLNVKKPVHKKSFL